MKLAISLFLILALSIDSADHDCDLAKVENAPYCEDEGTILTTGELVSDVTYFQCGECEVNFADAGECENCETELTEMQSGAKVCPSCFVKPIQAQVCIKSYYECSGCGSTSNVAGKCEDCEKTMKVYESKAVVAYECDECGTSSYTAGKCTDTDCEKHGKPLQQVCSESGNDPHVKSSTDSEDE